MSPLAHERPEQRRDEGEPQPVSVYAKCGCSWCSAAEALLRPRSVVLRAYDISDDVDVQEELGRRTERGSLPQTFIAGESAGGFEDVRDLDVRGSSRAEAERL